MSVLHAGCGMNHSRHDPRARTRDAGLARLRRATRVTFFGATALAGAFAGLAAHSAPGHKARAAATTTALTPTQATTQTATQTKTKTQVQAPTRAQTTTSAPAPTPVAPVAVTGTS